LSGAIKQPGADLAFELSDGLGQRRLSDADRRGRPAEVLVFCQSQRVPQLPDIHTTTISKRYGRDPNHGMAAISALAAALTSTHEQQRGERRRLVA
jgi:hypothetical protein